MGANFCILRRPISDQDSKTPAGTRAWTGSSFKEYIKPKCMKIDNRRSVNKNLKRKMEAAEKNIPKAKKLTLEDWILASPGLKPDYPRRGEFCPFNKQSKKKVHPSSNQFRGSLLGDQAKDSLSWDRHRPVNCNEESEGMSTNCSRIYNGKSRKRVRFKLPHIVIVYSPDEPYCKEASLSSPEEPYSSEDSFSSMGPNCTENSFDIAEEPRVRLAVDILPHVFVSSRI